jgi:tyrosyl-tRNA synthetase
VYAIIGGMTGLIGDPKDPKLSLHSDFERQLKSKKEVESNVRELSKQIVKYSSCTEVINNITFYEKMTV